MKNESLAPAFEAIAIRLVNGENAFIETLAKFGEISRADAVKVFNLYRKHKVTKRNASTGAINVKHGAYLDKENILHALTKA